MSNGARVATRGSSRPASLARFLLSGGYVRLFLALFVLGVGLQAAPIAWSAAAQAELPYLVDGLLVGTALLAVLHRAVRVGRTTERVFWLLVGMALSFYLATLTFVVDWAEPGDEILGLVEDGLHLSLYAAFFFAVALNPHLERDRRASFFRRRRVETLATIVFTLALICYFVLVPGAYGADGVETFAAQGVAYVLLDLSVLGSFLYLRSICEDARWRAIYAFVALALGAWAVVDLVEALMLWEVLPDPRTWYVELIWYLPYLPVLLAARVGERDWSREQGADGEPQRHLAFGGPTVAFLAVLPTMHLGGYVTGIFDPRFQVAREVGLLMSLASLAVLAVIARRVQEHESRLLGQRLQESQKLEAIGRLAGGVAHDFNNLLMVICGYSELALDRLRPEDPLRRELEEVLTAGKRAKILARQLLALGRRQPIALEVCDLNEVVEEAHQILDRLLDENIVLHFEPAARKCLVHADRIQLEQTLLNLAVNAKDAMPAGGRLMFKSRILSATSLPDLAGDADAYVVLTVQDTGCGMDGETLERALDPFFTTKEIGKGTGLGLAAALSIARHHGGDLRITSEPGAGTTATLYLPLAAGSTPAARTAHAQTLPVRGGDESILVVEDEEKVRSVVRSCLERRGYRVLTAADAVEAELVFDLHGTEIELLLTDVMMPGESGPILYRKLARRRPDLKVLFMSGYSPEELPVADEGEKEPEFILKPFEPEALCGRVRGVLDATSVREKAVPEPSEPLA